MRFFLPLVLLMAGCSPDASERPRADYNPQTGRLERIAFDANGNGRNDAVSTMDGARIHRIEIDSDENGRTDRWDFYGPQGKLEKVGMSRRNDGVMDAQAFYSQDGGLQRIEVSTRRDGRFDRVEFYESGVLVRSHDDTNADGQPDKWETYRPNPGAVAGEPRYAITIAEFDEEGRGRPQRRLFYGDNGVVIRLEVDLDGDGVFVLAPVKKP